MTITVILCEETEKRLRDDARAQGIEPGELAANLLEEIYHADNQPEDLDTIAQIREAIDEYEAIRERGETKMPAWVFYEQIRQALAKAESHEALTELERYAVARRPRQKKAAIDNISDADTSETIKIVQDAIARYDAGERGILLNEAFAELERRATARNKSQ